MGTSCRSRALRRSRSAGEPIWLIEGFAGRVSPFEAIDEEADGPHRAAPLIAMEWLEEEDR